MIFLSKYEACIRNVIHYIICLYNNDIVLNVNVEL